MLFSLNDRDLSMLVICLRMIKTQIIFNNNAATPQILSNRDCSGSQSDHQMCLRNKEKVIQDNKEISLGVQLEYKI